MSENEGSPLALRILVAEDNLQNQRVMQLILAAAGQTADYALDGAQARDMHLAQGYDLILMDIAMPVLDGVQATAEIRSFEAQGFLRRTVIVAVTANAMPDQLASYLEAGMDHVLPKPIRPQQVLEVLHLAAALTKPAAETFRMRQ